MELSEFLLARIAEDEAVARAATPGPWQVQGTVLVAPDESIPASAAWPQEADHIARWDPARVLAECEAKRALVLELQRMEWVETGWDGIEQKVMGYLALPYASHSDYAEARRP